MAGGKDSLRLIEGGLASGSVFGGQDFDASGTVAAGESEHALLQAGKISVNEYIDMSVDRALTHLRDQLGSERLSVMRSVLRDQLEQDPYLSVLVARAAAGE